VAEGHLICHDAEAAIEYWAGKEGVPLYTRSEVGWGLSGGAPIAAAKVV